MKKIKRKKVPSRKKAYQVGKIKILKKYPNFYKK